ncbi:sensor histidine kinase [Nocardiopsis composta]
MAVLLYAVAAAHPGRVAGGAAAITVAVCFAPAPLLAGAPFGQPIWISAVAVGVTVLGASVRGRRSAQRELARESELRRRDQERKAAAEERSRIARELHDVVSHHMSMIAIQAEAAPYKYPDLPPGAAETFTTIRDAARGALSEMRRVVGLLREQGEEAERAPQPGLERLADLVDGARQAGMQVDLEDRSAEAAPPDAVGRSAYRIVQEALSNAARHAHGAPVRVRLAPEGGALEVWVSNGPAPDAERSPGPRRATARVGTAWSACGSARRSSAAPWRPAPGPTAASGSAPCSRSPSGNRAGPGDRPAPAPHPAPGLPRSRNSSGERGRGAGAAGVQGGQGDAQRRHRARGEAAPRAATVRNHRRSDRRGRDRTGAGGAGREALRRTRSGQ